jgi:hypothetical protein
VLHGHRRRGRSVTTGLYAASNLIAPGGKEAPLRRANRVPAIRFTALVTLACASLAPRGAAAGSKADDLPHLDWNKPIRCMFDGAGKPVRVQCDVRDGVKQCLVASALADDGTELRRLNTCKQENANAYAALERAGVPMVRAVAEAPPGYARSEAGRAYQVAFDMLDRFYIGAAWAPTWQRPDARIPAPPGFPLGRARVEAGFTASVLSPHGRSRHDFRVLEGSASFSDFHVNGLLFAYDYQQVHRRPTFWLSTFFGEPKVFPGRLPLGFGFRLLRVEDRPPAFRRSFDMEFGELHVAWSPWQSADMYSHLRVEAGADVGKHLEDRAQGFGPGSFYVGPTAAIRSRFSLGEGGLHFLFVDVDWARPLVPTGDLAARALMRIDASFAYEGVLVAINDQPISVRLAATGSSREDPQTQVRSVELGATAGLRFSFWAPPRVFEPLPPFEDP